jgi:hypothetical protein
MASMKAMPRPALLPEEDAIEDPDEDDDEADPTLPGDLWFRGAENAAVWRRDAQFPIVYS